MAQRLAGHALAEIFGSIALAGAVDFFVEPGSQAVEFAIAEIGIQITQVVTGLFHELGREEVAQRVRGEIAEQASAPVDIL